MEVFIVLGLGELPSLKVKQTFPLPLLTPFDVRVLSDVYVISYRLGFRSPDGDRGG